MRPAPLLDVPVKKFHHERMPRAWSARYSVQASGSCTARLLDSGKLIDNEEGDIMHRKTSCRPIDVAIAAFLLLAPAAPGFAQTDSGFLKDYSQLQVGKDAKGSERRFWAKDKVNWQSYQAILVEPVDFYPKPEGTPQVTLGALNDIRNYLNAGIPKAIEANMKVAKEPGPGVLRLRSAITAVSVDKSLKPYQLIPIGLLITAAQRSGGSASYPVKLQVESELTDSVSGEVLARSVREAKGVEVKGDQPVTLKIAQPQIDLWLAGLREEVALRAKK